MVARDGGEGWPAGAQRNWGHGNYSVPYSSNGYTTNLSKPIECTPPRANPN